MSSDAQDSMAPHNPDRLSVEKGQRILDAPGIEIGPCLGDAVAEMRREHGMAQRAQGVVLGQGLLVEHVERRDDPARFDRGHERGLVDKRAAGSVDQDCALLHAANVFGADDAAASRRKDHMDRDGVGRGHELRFADEAGAALPGLVLGQIRAPGDDVHVERQPVAGHPGPKPAEADDAERLAGEAHPDRHAALEAARPDGGVGDGN